MCVVRLFNGLTATVPSTRLVRIPPTGAASWSEAEGGDDETGPVIPVDHDQEDIDASDQPTIRTVGGVFTDVLRDEFQASQPGASQPSFTLKDHLKEHIQRQRRTRSQGQPHGLRLPAFAGPYEPDRAIKGLGI